MTFPETKKSDYVWLAVAIIVILLIVFRKNIASMLGIGSTTTPPADGTACKTPDGQDGVYANGICVTSGGRPGGGDNGGGGTGKLDNPATRSGSIPKTYCIPIVAGTTCQRGIMQNGHHYAYDSSASSKTQCCYKLIK